ncbi:hypothetical protein NC651_014356 [Populus alba x Populus x berolinensis]|nr:hypothetical protein NC651_014356 [Populus alba x Populus x berolinensis]
MSSFSWVFCSSSCSPSRLPVRSFSPVFFSFSPFCSRCSCLYFCVRFPWSSFFVSVLWSSLSMCFRSSLFVPPLLVLLCSSVFCLMVSSPLFFFFAPPFSGFYKAGGCMIMSDLREWRPARSPLFEEKSGAKSPVIDSPILAFRDTSCG